MNHILKNPKLLLLTVIQKALRIGLNTPVIKYFAWKLAPIVRRLLNYNIEVLTTYDESIKIWARLSDHIESQIFWQGVQEGDRGEIALLKKLFRSDYIFIDVGANVGVFSMVAAKRLRSGQVHAFEPIEMHVKRFQRNILTNGFTNIVLNRFALSNKSGKIIMYIPKTANTGMASCYPFKEELDYIEKTVETITLDDYVLQKALKRVDVIKIDVEGAELDVLEGSLRVLKKFHPQVVLEVNKDHLGRTGRTLSDLFKFLRYLGYHIYKIQPDGLLSSIHDVQDFSWHQNIYCYWTGETT